MPTNDKTKLLKFSPIKKENIKQIARVVAIYLFSLVIIIGCIFAFSLLPIKNNYKIFTITSGSMGKALPKGNLIVVVPSKIYKKSEIVTFYGKNEKDIITHRIVSTESNQYVTKGDNNKFSDFTKISNESIIGKVSFSVPYIGKPILYAKTIPGLILLVIIPATIIVYEEIKKIIELLKKNSKLC